MEGRAIASSSKRWRAALPTARAPAGIGAGELIQFDACTIRNDLGPWASAGSPEDSKPYTARTQVVVPRHRWSLRATANQVGDLARDLNTAKF